MSPSLVLTTPTPLELLAVRTSSIVHGMLLNCDPCASTTVAVNQDYNSACPSRLCILILLTADSHPATERWCPDAAVPGAQPKWRHPPLPHELRKWCFSHVWRSRR